MDSKKLRQKFLAFFKERGHTIIPSASLIPENDSSVLFTTAGMFPLVPFFLGEKHPGGKRLADVQKCVRTIDIDEVGDATHHTFFEMLGNWSLGDYFKKEVIEWSWEFLTSPKWLGLDKNRIAVSVFAGDEDSPFDEEAYNIWKEIFEKNNLPTKRIAKLPKENNWWGLATGPCGPDSEMFYWAGDLNNIPEGFNDDNNLWVEIWNDVFMQYNKTVDGKYEALAQKNVDTGMGMERVLAAINGLDDNYKTELFWPIIKKIEEISKKKYGESEEITKAMRIIADHIKAATFLLAEKLEPSKNERGAVLRRLIRGAVGPNGRQLGMNDIFSSKIAEVIINIYKDTYPEINKEKDFILKQLFKEEDDFKKSQPRFKKMAEIMIENEKKEDPKTDKQYITGDEIYRIHGATGAAGPDIIKIAEEGGIEVRNIEDYSEGFRKHQEISRVGAERKFKGGLADFSEQTIKYHTAAHLMLAALRKVLGEHVSQKGSNITTERLRFDFSHSEKMTDEQIKKVEELVNQKIQEDLPVEMEEMSLEEAKTQGAMGVFESKYGERVKVYAIGDASAGSGQVFSREICGGPHVERTGILGKFKIVKEESSSAGVRRIKATLQ